MNASSSGSDVVVANAHARLWLFGASCDSVKAYLALRLSSAWYTTEVVMTDGSTIDHSMLDPSVARVPKIEIDGQFVIGSADITKYLMKEHIGPGDAWTITMKMQDKLLDFISLVEQWEQTVAENGGREVPRDFTGNDAVFEKIFIEATTLVTHARRHRAEGSNCCGLFSPELTSADACLASLLLHIQTTDKRHLKAVFARFPALRGYWSYFKQTR
eukprot:CAMPEP_0172905456 /NCGR_PEP_ID=MMETSP1075-20121228/174702_1 /TAXON_ID=2916 /ORGANISM="Ceratium fusus, Strain PA161109" /LENGTH=215 /DNA_ID=CAMNT_0013762693 /DNA_START=91 /DNA_END=735 /DNA_ORIENTATION=-